MTVQKPNLPAKQIEVDLNDVLNKIVTARAHLIASTPFFGYILTKLKLVPTTQLPTAATDGKHFFFNPVFISELAKDPKMGAAALETVLKHEAGHIALGHIFRGEHFLNIPFDDDLRKMMVHTKWSAATDHALNNILKESGSHDLGFWLCDEKYKDMSSEEIYKLLPEPKIQHINLGAGFADAFKDGCSSKGHNHDGTPCGGFMPHPAVKDGDEAAQQEAINDWRQTVAQAYMAAKQAGNMPGNLAQVIEELLTPKVNWVDQLRRFAEIVTRTNYTWRRANSRYMHTGFVLPTLLDKKVGTVVIAIDTSGSVNDSMLTQFASEINSILEDVRPEKVYVIHCDTEIAKVDEYESGDPLSFKVYGRGGTDFRPPFQWLIDNDVEPVFFCYLSDGECGSFADDPGCPVLWALTPHGQADFKPPYGDVLKLTDD